VSVNRYRPHLLVIPEDDANRQVANGFVQDDRIDPRAAQVLPPAGGWTHVIDGFLGRAKTMARFPGQKVVLLIDFDEQNRLLERMAHDVRPFLFP